MGLDALAFLRKVLPDNGYYAAFTKFGDRKYNRFFATVEELAWHIAAEDALGRTVYHACASFGEPTRRTGENAVAVKALWFDIEAGDDGDPYTSISDAIGAVAGFCRATAIPQPIIVGSGGGIHCYWSFDRAVSVGTWQPYAVGLKQAANNHGLVIDPVRTGDIASVLRTPGTHNRKYEPPRQIQVGGLVGPHDVRDFDHLKAFGAVLQPSGMRSAVPITSNLTRALIVEPEYEEVYADNIANGCAQLAALRERRGNIAEPAWYACLGVLSRCEDGEEKAHAWSSGHPQYSEKETQEKLDRTRALTGATTCAKFESVNPKGCVLCPLRNRIVSPISAGNNREVSIHHTKVPILSDTQPPISDGNSILPVLPPPFSWNERSQLICNTEKGDANVEVLISAHPIYLAGIGVGEVRGDRFAFHFRQWLPSRGWFDLFVPAGKIMGQQGTAELAERGATIHDHKMFLAYVRAAADQFHATERLKMHYDQCGWKDELAAFLVGDCLYSSEGVTENVTVSQELATRAQWIGPQTGTLEGWSGAANALFASGCEAQSFALACAFAAPLMRLQASDEGGAVVNLLSHGSGTGKTTALAAIYSAWGKKQGLSLTKIDTRVSKAITLGVLGNLPVVYDELGDRDPLVIREFIMMFTNGRDKMRGTADGTIMHQQSSWQTLMITASNMSVHDLLAHTGGSDALAYRVLEYTCKLPTTVVAAKGDRLRKDMENNAGWAGDAFMDYLIEPSTLAWTKEALEKWTRELWEKHGNKPEHRFWMRTLGAVAVASTLVNKAGILDFSPSRVLEWGISQLLPAPHIQVDVVDSPQRALEVLSNFLNEHVGAALVMPGPFLQGVKTRLPPLVKPLNRVFMRYEVNPPRLFISDQAFRQWLLAREIGSREVVEALEEISLVTNRKRYVTLTAGTDIPGAQQACIEINAAHPAISGVLAPVVDMAKRQNNKVQA